MKRILVILFILLAYSLNAQKIGLQQFEYTCQLESLEKKSDFFMSKQFAKESSNKDSIVKFVKKIYIKRTQEFDLETITVFSDTITYSLQDPKKYATFKKTIESSYKRLQENESPKNTIIYRKKRFTIRLTEKEITLQNPNRPTTIYNFSISNNNL